VARQKVMIAGTEVQVSKAQDTATAAAAVGKGKGKGKGKSDGDGDGEETSDTLDSNSNGNGNSNSKGNGNSNRSSSGQGNGQTKKKGKYSHKDSNNTDKDKNPNGTSSDNKKTKRKKYVIYTDNPAVGKVENEAIEMASETVIVTEAGIGGEIGTETGTIISNESVTVNDSMSGENDNSHIIDNTTVTSTEEMIKVENRQENDAKKSEKMKIEILEEKMRVEERKKEGLEKLLRESVLNAQKEEEEQERNEDEIELSRKGGRGTFSVGCLPKPLNCPKGNTLFPGTYVRSFL
jgi:hypothetical protein